MMAPARARHWGVLRLAQLAMFLAGLCVGQPPLTSDCQALRTLHNYTSVRPWKNASGWSQWNTTMPDCCKWYGVQCIEGRVTSLNLTDNGLLGVIPTQIGLLHRMHILILADNMIKGPIPTELFHIKGDFACGSFSGPRCDPFATNDPNSQCTGGTTCNSYGGLRWLDLKRNRLSGSIPVEISRTFRTLMHVDLSINRLSGPIPATMGALVHVGNLNLFYNRLEGTLPPEIGYMVTLRHLNLGFNRLEGTVPHFFGNLERLEQLDLSANRLHASLPDSLGVLVAPPTEECDWPSGPCFGKGLRETDIASGSLCEPGQYTLWFVQGIKQPCTPGGTTTDWWCGSCAPPFPSTPDPQAEPCWPVRSLPPETTPFFNFVSPPWAPNIPTVPARSPVSGPRLRLSCVPRCTRDPSLYASNLTMIPFHGVMI
mmetsp:Transcript_45820/g.111576  ORF Transcript_45820/g.111576 Transcript_45820/m.111576 type:complete len:427 (+) Transcript_45820:127-1407(+)